jgi:succinate dehydrogenase iron-sulfur subunit
MPDDIKLRIKRQRDPGSRPYWERFAIPYRPNMNIISVLLEIQERPVTAEGNKTTPVTWDCNCLEEVCGACSMLINGRARQACSALVDQLSQPITLEPFSKFPCIRDLQVDRSSMFRNLIRAQAWVPIDGTYPLGEGPRLLPKVQEESYPYSRCMTCGCCLEVCPQFMPIRTEEDKKKNFVGAQIYGQVRLFNAHPTGRAIARERIETMLDEGGLADCGNAQNCVKACPKEIPLTDAIAELNREAVKQGIFGWFHK